VAKNACGHAFTVLLLFLVMLGAIGCVKKETFYDAASTNDLKKVAAILKSRPAFATSHDVQSPLFYANSKEMVELLLANKADVNATNYAGQTPLFRAAWNGKSELVEALLARGADAKITSEWFGSPLQAAVLLGNDSAAHIAELLLAHGAAVNAVSKNESKTPLHWAAMLGETDVVAVLLAHGALVDARDHQDRTPLHQGVSHSDIAKLLLDNKADVNAKDKRGETPLFGAIQSGHLDSIELLIKRGADVTARDNEGKTPLHIVAESRACGLYVVDLLLANKADINARDNEGKTPLQRAIANRNDPFASYFRQHGGQE